MIHRLLLPSCLIIVAFLFYSCNNLDVGNAFLKKPPQTSTTLDSIFSRAKFAKQFLWGAYRTLPYGLMYETGNSPYDGDLMQDDPLANITDIGYSFGPNGGCINWYYSGAYSAHTEDIGIGYTATKFDFYDSGAWAGIRKAWMFINNIDRVPDTEMSDQMKSRLKAEARLIIAIHYVDLFRNYGGMMWVGHAYGSGDDFYNPRMTAMATLDSTLMLINKVIANPNLPWSLNNAKKIRGVLPKHPQWG